MTVTLDQLQFEQQDPHLTITLSRDTPIIHPSSDAPLCQYCHQLDLPFFDPTCHNCLKLLQNPETTVPQIFAIIRQWVPQTQQNIELLVNEVLKRGAHVNDRDGLTDMTLLHYACKAGASGVGDVSQATKTAGMLLDYGADVYLRCRWTDMAPIHYAVYFDVSPVLELLFKATKGTDIDMPCREFENGSPLHIATTNLCTEAAKFLVEHGASVVFKDDLGRTPLDCVPEFPDTDSSPDLKDAILTLKKLLQRQAIDPLPVTGKAVLQAMGLQFGDKVLVGGVKIGILRYCGATQFATGIWAGIELLEPLGKNDGTLNNITYFKCASNHGLFAPFNKILKYDGTSSPLKSPSRQLTPQRNISYPRVDVSHVTPKVETGLHPIRNQPSVDEANFGLGDRVMVSGRRKGIIRFCGETKFAPGWWFGIELDKPVGKNDGTINGVQYFSCQPTHGVFSQSAKLTKLCDNEEVSDHDSAGDFSMSVSRSSTDGELGNSSPISLSSSGRKPFRTSKFLSGTPIASQDRKCWLTVGVNVFVNNEIGIVRYIGPVDFSEGMWLGVELRANKGKNDGSIQGHKYFTCRPGHGLIVKPNRVTVRGINGAKLMPSE